MINFEEFENANIDELVKKWKSEGHKILDKKYWDKWDKCVPIRLDDIYRGMELPMCLDIIKELNNGCELEKAKEIIKRQNHTGLSWGLMCSMVSSFCDRGKEFTNYVN